MFGEKFELNEQTMTIVEEIGRIKNVQRGAKSITFCIEANKVLEDTRIGDSICTNGVCLTVTDISPAAEGKGWFKADVMPETIRKTSMAKLQVGSKVNLERALTLNTRLGGHIVSGHIDGTGRFVGAQNEENAVNVTISADKSLGRYIIEKGSVALDGISLTVASVKNEGNYGEFSVAVIPHTWENTALKNKRVGSIINVECDVVGKYIEHFVNIGSSSPTSSEKIDMMTFTSFHKN